MGAVGGVRGLLESMQPQLWPERRIAERTTTSLSMTWIKNDQKLQNVMGTTWYNMVQHGTTHYLIHHYKQQRNSIEFQYRSRNQRATQPSRVKKKKPNDCLEEDADWRRLSGWVPIACQPRLTCINLLNRLNLCFLDFACMFFQTRWHMPSSHCTCF